jgi:Tfp pilus assembly protein FimV
MFDRPLDTEQAFAHPEPMERTYVRRRRTVAVVAIALVAVLLSPLAAGAVRRGEAPAPTAQQVVVVRSGDTLWSIAQRVRPGDDPRVVSSLIASANGVEAGSLPVGTSVVVPAG